ncbi:MAG TPA: hypothetical protein P5291_06730, partial [Flavobacteriales bacterium]|nr:hypothetical protein [Flavobacteriales bacterium]
EHRSRDEDGFKRLLKSPAVRAWSALLTDDGDLNAHRSELPVDGLPLGNYQLIVSDAESFALDGTLVLFTPFTITRLALTTREQPDRMTSVLVTDRVSGAPLRSAKAELFSQRWSNGTYRDLPIGSALTDEQGIARVPVPNDLRGQYTWKVSHAGDQQRISSYGWYQVEDPDRDTSAPSSSPTGPSTGRDRRSITKGSFPCGAQAQPSPRPRIIRPSASSM